MRNKVGFLVLFVGFLLCACNKKNDIVIEVPAEETEPVVINWAVWDTDLTVYYQPLIEAFEAACPDIRVEMLDFGSSDYTAILAAQLTGGDSIIDVMLIKDIPGYSMLISKDYLEPLITPAPQEAYGGIIEQILIDDKLYGLPFRSDFWVIFYNKDLFDQAGVAYPDNDMTFAQYDTLARQIANDEEGIAKIYGAHYHIWRSAVQLFGILDGEHTILAADYSFLQPFYEMVLGQQKDGIVQDYAVLKTGSIHYSAAFHQGNVGMMNMGTWHISTLIEGIAAGESKVKNWGLVKYPHGEGISPGSTLATITTVGVNKTSANKEAAKLFAAFICGEEGAGILADTGNSPALYGENIIDSMTQVPGFPADENSREALSVSHAYLEMPLLENSSEIEVFLNEVHDEIMTESISIEDGLSWMQEQMARYLK